MKKGIFPRKRARNRLQLRDNVLYAYIIRRRKKKVENEFTRNFNIYINKKELFINTVYAHIYVICF